MLARLGIDMDDIPAMCDEFPIGTRVTVVPDEGSRFAAVDFIHIPAGYTGTVVANRRKYLGITVEMDNITFQPGMKTWNFQPWNLRPVLHSGYRKA